MKFFWNLKLSKANYHKMSRINLIKSLIQLSDQGYILGLKLKLILPERFWPEFLKCILNFTKNLKIELKRMFLKKDPK